MYCWILRFLGFIFRIKWCIKEETFPDLIFGLSEKLTWKWLHRELGIIEKKCGYKMCSSNSTGRKHCKMIIEKQKIAFIDLLKKQTINKNKSLHFIFFFNWSKNQLSMPFIKIRNNLYWRWTKRINLNFLRGKERFF